MSRRYARDRDVHQIVFAVIGVVAVLLFAAFGLWWHWNHTPVEGTVVHRQHSDSYWYQVTSCSGNPISCHTSSNYMPESWQLCVEGHDRHGRVAEDCVDVSKGSWFGHPEGTEWHR